MKSKNARDVPEGLTGELWNSCNFSCKAKRSVRTLLRGLRIYPSVNELSGAEY
jgi:hypothetical protein